MKKMHLLVIPICILLSCSATDENLVPDDKVEDVELYVFDKIEFLADNSSIESMTIELALIDYSNWTEKEQVYSYTPSDMYLSESSQFVPNSSDVITIKEFEVNVPVFIHNNKEVSLGSRTWKYNNLVQKQKSELNFSKDFTISANRKLTIKSKMYYKQYVVNYKLYIKEQKTGEQKLIEGKWFGVYPDDCHTEGILSTL